MFMTNNHTAEIANSLALLSGDPALEEKNI